MSWSWTTATVWLIVNFWITVLHQLICVILGIVRVHYQRYSCARTWLQMVLLHLLSWWQIEQSLANDLRFQCLKFILFTHFFHFDLEFWARFVCTFGHKRLGHLKLSWNLKMIFVQLKICFNSSERRKAKKKQQTRRKDFQYVIRSMESESVWC